MSPSGYYAWLKRAECERVKSDRQLLKKIDRIYHKSRGTYGSPRVHQALRQEHIRVGRKRVERLMRNAGLQARAFRQYRHNPSLHRFFDTFDNVRLSVGKPTAINQQWVSDITYLRVGKEWRYLTTVMDLYSRKIISWSLRKRRTTESTLAAINTAIAKRRPRKGLIFHTDRGIEFRGECVQRVLRQHGIISSMNRPYRSVDNAEMESFYKTLKGDVIRGRVYKIESELRRDIRSYINHFYNTQRLHSSIGYRTPVEYESIAA